MPKHIAKDNQRLADALKENNVPRVMGFLDHPFVNFGDKRVDHIIEQLNKPENVEKLKTRVSQDEGRQIELLMLEKGNAVVNRETGEVVALDRKHKRKESNKNSEEQTTNMKQGFRKQKGNEGMSF